MGSLCPGRRQGPEASDGDQCPSRTSNVQTRPFMTLWEEERRRASSLRYGRKARSLPRMRVGLGVKVSLRTRGPHVPGQRQAFWELPYLSGGDGKRVGKLFCDFSSCFN